MGWAVACAGMSRDEFCTFYVDEFEAVAAEWNKMTEAAERANWERMRLGAAIGIQPHVRRRITPRQLVPLPWDNDERPPRPEAPQLTPEERLKRFETLTAQMG